MATRSMSCIFAGLRLGTSLPCIAQTWPSSLPRTLPHSRNASTKAGPKSSSSSDNKGSESVSEALRQASAAENSLLAPVHIPRDPHGVLHGGHPAAKILEQSALVVQRELEMMNVMLGFEQANKYVIMDPKGQHLGFMAEQDSSLGRTVARQMFRTHRSFTTHIFDRDMKEVLRFQRPFSWISSRIRVYDAVAGPYALPPPSDHAPQMTALSTAIAPEISALPLSQMPIIGEAQQYWAPLRRKYNLFVYRGGADAPSPTGETGSTAFGKDEDYREGSYDQFAKVDEPFLSWDFSLRSADNQLLGSVNRNFAGLGRELFTDTGVYALRMDAAGLAEDQANSSTHSSTHSESAQSWALSREQHSPGMTLDQRAVMLATAVSIDFDYFSRQRGGMMFFPVWLGGGEAAGEAGAVGAAGAAGAAGEAGAAEVAGSTAGSVVRGAGAATAAGGASEGAIGAAATGAASISGYEAMQRAMNGRSDANPSEDAANVPMQDEALWGPQSQEPRPPSSDGSSGGGGSGGGDGGGGFFDVSDWF